MIISNTETVPGHEVKQILGIVMGNTVRAKHIGKDIMAGLKSVVGGEIRQYSEMLTDARIEAMNRMVNHGKKLGANAVINVGLTTSTAMQGAAEILAYGTAVKLGKA